jgi:hypothetical protein
MLHYRTVFDSSLSAFLMRSESASSKESAIANSYLQTRISLVGSGIAKLL